MKVTIKTLHFLDSDEMDGVDVNIDLSYATLPMAMSTLIDLLKFMGYSDQNIKDACAEYASDESINYI